MCGEFAFLTVKLKFKKAFFFEKTRVIYWRASWILSSQYLYWDTDKQSFACKMEATSPSIKTPARQRVFHLIHFSCWKEQALLVQWEGRVPWCRALWRTPPSYFCKAVTQTGALVPAPMAHQTLIERPVCWNWCKSFVLSLYVHF